MAWNTVPLTSSSLRNPRGGERYSTRAITDKLHAPLTRMTSRLGSLISQTVVGDKTCFSHSSSLTSCLRFFYSFPIQLHDQHCDSPLCQWPTHCLKGKSLEHVFAVISVDHFQTWLKYLSCKLRDAKTPLPEAVWLFSNLAPLLLT
jgi:hypothetical protein